MPRSTASGQQKPELRRLTVSPNQLIKSIRLARQQGDILEAFGGARTDPPPIVYARNHQILHRNQSITYESGVVTKRKNGRVKKQGKHKRQLYYVQRRLPGKRRGFFI